MVMYKCVHISGPGGNAILERRSPLGVKTDCVLVVGGRVVCAKASVKVKSSEYVTCRFAPGSLLTKICSCIVLPRSLARAWFLARSSCNDVKSNGKNRLIQSRCCKPSSGKLDLPEQATIMPIASERLLRFGALAVLFGLVA